MSAPEEARPAPKDPPSRKLLKEADPETWSELTGQPALLEEIPGEP